MARIELTTSIQAPTECCFLLSLSVDLHKLSTASTQEEAIDGVTSGIMKLGDFVTWRAKHLGIWQTLSTRITEYQYPSYFCDEMIRGAFKSLRHEHHFLSNGEITIMQDIFLFESPLGIFGKMANKFFLKAYLKKFLSQRNQLIKEFAESERWKLLLQVKTS
jgi:ligand-binding SRPBCC domain-containing protein